MKISYPWRVTSESIIREALQMYKKDNFHVKGP